MNQKQVLIGAGVIGLLGVAWYMSASGEVVGGNSGGGGGGMALPGGGGGGMALPGGGEIVSSPVPVSGSTPQVGYNLAFPELQPVPKLPEMQTIQEPSPDTYDTTKKSQYIRGVPVNAPDGGTVYAYGVSKSYTDSAKSEQSKAIASGKPSTSWTAGKSIAPGVTMAEPTKETTTSQSSKKDSNIAAAVSAGFGAGLSSTPVGQAANAIGSVASGFGSVASRIDSAIGGLFGW